MRETGMADVKKRGRSLFPSTRLRIDLWTSPAERRENKGSGKLGLCKCPQFVKNCKLVRVKVKVYR